MVVWMESLRDILGPMAGVEPHPPFAVLSIVGWVKLVGSSEFAARYLSVLSGVATIAAVYQLGRLLFSDRAGLLAGFLWVINPYQIWFSQDLRSTALWIALSATATVLLLLALRAERDALFWGGYVALMALSLYTFYLEFFILAVHGVIGLSHIWQHRQKLKSWLIAQAALAALLAPWFVQPRLYTGGYAPTAGPVNLPWAAQAFLFGETLPAPLQTISCVPQEGGWAAYLAVCLALVSLGIVWWRYRGRPAFVLTLYALAPLLMLALVEWVLGRGYFRPRYVASSTPAWIVLIAAACAAMFYQLKQQRIGCALGGVVLAGLVGLNALGLGHYYFNPDFKKAPDWRILMTVLNTEVSPQDVVIRNYPDPTFLYYYDNTAQVVLLPEAPGISPQSILESLPKAHSYIWFLPQPDPYWDAEQMVQSWLSESMQLVGERTAGDFLVQLYAGYEASEQDIDQHTEIIFTDLVELVGYTTRPAPDKLTPGEDFTLELFWRPLNSSTSSLTVFTHLLGPPREDGSIMWGGQDHPPQEGRADTTLWETGVLLRDVYHLNIPAGAPAGTYSVEIGLYDPGDGTRIVEIQTDRPQSEAGSVQLFTVQVGAD